MLSITGSQSSQLVNYQLLLVVFYISEDYVLISKHQSHIYVMLSVLNEILGWLMVVNATLNNISVTSGQSILLVDETGVPGEDHRSVAGQ